MATTTTTTTTTSTSQHRCVFVGNIPYDATEEQLMDICREVGPVVSFRLVIDRETGKPKGYGFCEYKDEETALSARRNLQGYEINGRQLRVDFAENDNNKPTDKTRDQGRGGPGVPANPEGRMCHFDLGTIVTQSIQIMLGIVPPQVLQMPNIRQASTQPMPLQQSVVQDPRLPPLAQKVQSGLGHNQFPVPSQLPITLPQISAPLLRATNHGASLHGQDTIPSMHPSAGTQTQLASSSALYQVGAANFGDKPQIVPPPRSTTDAHFQPGPSKSFGMPDALNRNAGSSGRDDTSWTHKSNAYSNMPFSSAEKKPMIHNSLEANNRPSKILKVGHFNAPNAPGSSSQAFGVNSSATKLIPKVVEMQYPEKQISQPQLPSDVESALLQQVMKLTPEQINSLPPDQRQQVIQLQQALLQKPT
ncbi:hypothetical protein ACFE04_007112 [Oxalis oulophora]